LPDLFAHPGCKPGHSVLDGIRAIDPLCDGGGQLLRALLISQRLEETGPTRLVADLGCGQINAAIDQLVDLTLAPFRAHHGFVIEFRKARFKRLPRYGLDRALKRFVALRLAGAIGHVGIGAALRWAG
jgi:hypothetical protein